ncbi:MAG: ribonuclease P protein component [Solirubrobacteraceae bacterium]|nr:ribonuclease P protein component [Solirubrobacteraceae bacterium]
MTVSGRAKRGRLTRSADFERVYRQGRSHGNRYFVLYAFPRSGEGEARLGVSVSRKVGGAVDRNRVKRLLREAVAQADPGLPDGVDVVVVARPDARELAEREGLAGVQGALAELLEKAAAAAKR